MHRPVEVSLGSGTYPFWSCFKAEFLKAFATRLPQIAYAAIFGLVFLFVFQAYHMGGLNEILAEEGHKSMYYAVGLLLFRTWDTLLFQLFVLSSTVYLTLQDSQTGMIRVVCSQPFDRASLALCRLTSISAHAALFGLAYCLALVAWTTAYSGLSGIGAHEASRVLLAWCYTIVQTASLAGLGFALALFWRSVAAGLVGVFTSCLAFVLLLITVRPLASDATRQLVGQMAVFNSRLPVRMLPLPKLWIWINPNEPVPIETQLGFLLAAVVTPLVLCIPALVHFSRRDITE